MWDGWMDEDIPDDKKRGGSIHKWYNYIIFEGDRFDKFVQIDYEF